MSTKRRWTYQEAKKVADAFCREIKKDGKKRSSTVYEKRYSQNQKSGYKVKLFNIERKFAHYNEGMLYKLVANKGIKIEIIERVQSIPHFRSGRCRTIRSFIFKFFY